MNPERTVLELFNNLDRIPFSQTCSISFSVEYDSRIEPILRTRMPLVSKAHDQLYHYTNYDGFKGIFASQTLWAKYYRDLNDTTEIIHVRTKLFEPLAKHIKKYSKAHRSRYKAFKKKMGGWDALAQQIANEMLDAFFEGTFGNDRHNGTFSPFVVSFCSHLSDDDYTRKNGLLSMWRGYGSGGGIAIVFDTLELERCLKIDVDVYSDDFGGLGDVIYDGDGKAFEEEFAGLIPSLIDNAMSIADNKGNFNVGTEFVELFLTATTRFKHQAFKEEREVRLTVAPLSPKAFAEVYAEGGEGKKIRKSHKRGDAEYIDLFECNDVTWLPIIGVIVGPHAEQKKREQEIRDLLKHRPQINVWCSDTPYRETNLKET